MFKKKIIALSLLGASIFLLSPPVQASGSENKIKYVKYFDSEADREASSDGKIRKPDIIQYATGIVYHANGYVKGTARAVFDSDEPSHKLIYKQYVKIDKGIDLGIKYTTSAELTVSTEHNINAKIEFPIKFLKSEIGYQYDKKYTHVIKKGQEIDAKFKQSGEYVVRVFSVGENHDLYGNWKATVYPGKETIVENRYLGWIIVPTPFQTIEITKQ
ncbi:hypothetical protein [Brevibacillus laterosporus]|uniref:hypothetical protein n=1 Tax=Brevibacillus laterosporus TaxID=1465 RepID=UPI0018CC7C41|nr:hypothetical protein [Brevibacillus laterosporus]MBG9787879.1 hypothetical protein [Brevibacillus laterosporus]